MREVDCVSAPRKDLLGVEEVSAYLGVGPVTVYRWCREGRLPCLKVGKAWRIRREALEDFLRQGERPATLTGQLWSFLTVPDNVLTVAQDHELLHRLDAAFLGIGEARGGMLVKFAGGEPVPEDELRADLESKGLAVGRLEEEGRFRFVRDRRSRTGGQRPCGSSSPRRAVREAAPYGPPSTGQSRWTRRRRCGIRRRLWSWSRSGSSWSRRRCWSG